MTKVQEELEVAGAALAGLLAGTRGNGAGVQSAGIEREGQHLQLPGCRQKGEGKARL